MRLLFVNSAWPESWGGGEKWTISAAEWFGNRGHSTLVIGRPQSELLAAAAARNIDHTPHEFRGDFDPRSLFRAYQLLRRFRPDLVCVNFNKEAWQFGLAGRLRGIPVVARHGYPLLRKSVHHRLLAGQLLKQVIVNAESLRENYRTLGYDMSTVAVILNGVTAVEPCPGELRARFGVGPDQFLIVGSGRLESQKRFDLFLEVAEKLLTRFSSLQFLIFGKGPFENELRARIRARGLDHCVRLAGFTGEFASLIGDADMFLLTSENEGTPNVMLEAMIAGVPTLAFSVGAVPQVLSGEFANFAVPFGDTSLMASRAAELVELQTDRPALRSRFQHHARGSFSLEMSLQAYEQLFSRWIPR